MEKLIIFPGDWHLLKNYQEVLMKEYFHSGLKEIAMEVGYRGSTLKSLEKCSHFKRTHDFLMQVWEAMSRYILTYAFETLASEPAAYSYNTEEETLPTVNNQYKLVESYIQHASTQNNLVKYWGQFVLQDCFCYVQLFLAIRSSDWKLRLSAIKQMAPLFFAFDQDVYKVLIPHHLAEMSSVPKQILDCFENGGFTVSQTGQPWGRVALDEAHEMYINKDLKSAVVRPSTEYLQKTSLFFNYRITCYKNFMGQLFCRDKQKSSGIKEMSLTSKKYSENIQKMYSYISQNQVLKGTADNIVNPFTKQIATPQQTNDLLTFRKVGNDAFTDYIAYRVIGVPSTNQSVPVRKSRLLTLAPLKTVTKRKFNEKEKELKEVTRYLRRRLEWCRVTGEPYDPNEMYSIYPRALCDNHGFPHSGVKSVWLPKLSSLYTTPIIQDQTPMNWIADAVIIDAMFILHTKPMRMNKTISAHSQFLFNKFVLPHYMRGSLQVHLVFDKKSQNKFDPKQFERMKRDSTATKKQHQCIDLTPTTEIPTKWQEYIGCRSCKKSIIYSIGLSMLRNREIIRGNQKLILAGCFNGDDEDIPIMIKGNELPEPVESLKSNAEEGDIRMWRHVKQVEMSKVLIYSPDTDVYNIGLGIFDEIGDKDVVVQISAQSQGNKYVSLPNLIQALEKDPDLSTIDKDCLKRTMQTLFIVTGCDYISYFRSMGKKTFIDQFCQHAGFITGGHMVGHLSQTFPGNKHLGFLSFIRLIGVVYFKRHLSIFSSRYSCETPEQLFHSIDENLIEEKHKKWIMKIREVVNTVINSEEERIPSVTSLELHWLRACWVSMMWTNAFMEDVYGNLPPPENSGWSRDENGVYSIKWEENCIQEQIKDKLSFLMKGCRCKSGCKTKSCGCKKQGNQCGPACECHNCVNTKRSEHMDMTVREESTNEDREGTEEISETESENDENEAITENESSDEELELEIVDMDIDDIIELELID